jgi:hypothetical protein
LLEDLYWVPDRRARSYIATGVKTKFDRYVWTDEKLPLKTERAIVGKQAEVWSNTTVDTDLFEFLDFKGEKGASKRAKWRSDTTEVFNRTAKVREQKYHVTKEDFGPAMPKDHGDVREQWPKLTAASAERLELSVK